HAGGRDVDVDWVAGRRRGAVPGEHELWGDVLEVGHQQEAVLLIGDGQQAGEVVIEPELASLRGGGLCLDVQLRRVRQHRVAPADDHSLLITVGGDDHVLTVGRDGREVHAGRLGGGGRGGGWWGGRARRA